MAYDRRLAAALPPARFVNTGMNMNRICVINISGASCDLVRNDGQLWIGSLPFSPRPMEATFPALAASVQASMTTGAEPGEHGIVAGGLFRRESRTVSFD